MKRKDIQQSYSAGPPWIFNGRAFYQLHLVKADIAKRFIPSELNIVQAFGYTLGGLYLAQYDSSPAGTFDELVVIAGTVWNPPTSCAWAARVLVNSAEARDHGKREVGLPSRFADFSQSLRPIKKGRGWWDFESVLKLHPRQTQYNVNRSTIDILEFDGSQEKPLCQILFPFDRENKVWPGPSISMSLPSFSGRTPEQPHLLKYSCQLKCSIRPMKSMIITTPDAAEDDDSSRKAVLDILSSRPLVTLSFENMMMHVEAPKILDIKENPLSKVSFGSSKVA